MAATDPTYPLYPLVCLVGAILLLLVFISGFLRQSWNLGVTFLCFWLFFENLTYAANTIIWSDNADVKLYIYCDIVSHLQLVAFVVKPMSTLIIMRRLYLIASLRILESPSKIERQLDRLKEWTLGLIMPILYAVPLYYVLQRRRFIVLEAQGCTNAMVPSVLYLLLRSGFILLPPAMSLVLYQTRLALILYRQRREVSAFLQSNAVISEAIYMRVLAVATVDVIVSLIGSTVRFALDVQAYVISGHIVFYQGWDYVHSEPWGPVGVSWEDWNSDTPMAVASDIYTEWMSPIICFAIFGCFGLTPGARAAYQHALCTAAGWFGLKAVWPGRLRCTTLSSALSSLRFNCNVGQPQDVSLASCELGPTLDVVDTAPPSVDAGAEGKEQAEDTASRELDERKDSRSLYSSESGDLKRGRRSMETAVTGETKVFPAADLV
ncbi:unnamed protein product [Peniophora sp. CBMAI 1063]|nr:unnamed protein product [Peniophora sp. CBMAI 1063]